LVEEIPTPFLPEQHQPGKNRNLVSSNFNNIKMPILIKMLAVLLGPKRTPNKLYIFLEY